MNSEESLKPHWLNRRLIVDAKFQIPMLMYTLFIIVATTAFNFASRHLMDPEFLQAHAYDAGLARWIILVMGTLTFLVIFLMMTFLSHRIAGPLYRLKNHMASLTSGGEPRPIQFRKQDHFRDLALQYNELIRQRIK